MQASTNDPPAPAAPRTRTGRLALLRSGGGGGLLLMVGGTFVTQAMLLGTGIVTARLLGVEGRGQVALVLAVSTLVARLTLGGSLPVAVAQLLARDRLNAKVALRPFAGRWVLLAAAPSLAGAGYLYVVLDDVSPALRIVARRRHRRHGVRRDGHQPARRGDPGRAGQRRPADRRGAAAPGAVLRGAGDGVPGGLGGLLGRRRAPLRRLGAGGARAVLAAAATTIRGGGRGRGPRPGAVGWTAARCAG